MIRNIKDFGKELGDFGKDYGVLEQYLINYNFQTY